MANDVNFSIGADTKSAERSIDSLTNSLKTIQKFAAAAIAVFAGKQVVDFFSAGTNAAIAQEKAMAALAQQLKLSGDFSDEALASFAAFGDQMELTSQFGDDVVISQVAVAKAMGLTNEESKKLVQAAIELSAATGDSLDSSVQALGKTFEGITSKSPVLRNALSGISVEALKAGKGLDAVLSALGGSSEAQIQTFSGSLKQAENAFGNFQESFGKLIIENPALIAGIQAVTEGFRALQATIEENGSSITDFITGAVQALAVAFSVAVDSLGFFIRAFQGLSTVVTLAVGGFLTIADAIGTTLASSLGIAITLVLKLSDALGTTEKAADKFEGFVDGQIKGLRKMTDSTLNFAAKNNQSFEEFNRDYKKFGENVDNLAQKVFQSNDKQLKSTKKLQQDTRASQETSNAAILKNQKIQEEKITNIVIVEAKDRQKQIKDIIENTNIFQQIKLSLDPDAASDLKSEITKNLGTIAANIGATVVAGVASGAAGASSVADTVANLISKIPVVGGLIAELVKLAGQAPEENKKNIQGFVKGIPQFLENVNVNLGALNGILTEVIGPIIKKVIDEVGIFDLLSKLGQNLVSLPGLIKTIALGVRDGLRGSGGELSDAFKKGVADTKAEIGRFAESVRNFFGTFANQLRSAFDYVFKNNPLLNELKSMKELITRVKLVIEFISTLFQSIPGAFVQIRDTINAIADKFNGAFENLGAKFSDGFLQVRDQIASLFSGLATAFKNFPGQIRDALSDLFNGIKDAIKNAFSGEKIKGATEKVKGGFNLPKFATGITEVPSGFENDGFLARLSSGERVVDKNSNQDLKDFLSNSRAGGLGNDQMISLLSEISSKLNNSGSQTIEVTVDKKVLGKTILDLNRRNERLATR